MPWRRRTARARTNTNKRARAAPTFGGPPKTLQQRLSNWERIPFVLPNMLIRLLGVARKTLAGSTTKVSPRAKKHFGPFTEHAGA